MVSYRMRQADSGERATTLSDGSSTFVSKSVAYTGKCMHPSLSLILSCCIVFFFVYERIRFVFLCMSWSIYLHFYPAFSDEHIPTYLHLSLLDELSLVSTLRLVACLHDFTYCLLESPMHQYQPCPRFWQSFVRWRRRCRISRRVVSVYTDQRRIVWRRRWEGLLTWLLVDLVWRYPLGLFRQRVDRSPPRYRWLVDEPRRSIHQHSFGESSDLPLHSNPRLACKSMAQACSVGLPRYRI